jgi:hypothetical protein
MVQAIGLICCRGAARKQVLDLRADPKVSREMAGYLLDDNAAVLRNQGIAPTPTNLYLAHFLGVNDAAKVLKAAPGTPVSDVVTPASIAANKSVLEGKTTDTVIDWSGRKMGGSQRGKGGLVDFIPEDKRMRCCIRHVKRSRAARSSSSARSKLQAEQVKAQSDSPRKRDLAGSVQPAAEDERAEHRQRPASDACRQGADDLGGRPGAW